MRYGLVLLLVLSGCALLDPETAYYADGWNPPKVDALSATSEIGNLGGGTIDLVGSNFGTDPNQLVVVFGNHNAEIVAITDTRVTVRVPNGPITGGPVTVTAAGPKGYTAYAVPYVYDVGTVADDEIGYVQVNNYWESCYGGLSTRLEDEWSANLGCSSVAYMGLTGTQGLADRYNFAYPRVHTESQGYFGGTDLGDAEWFVERPGQVAFSFGTDDLHEDIGAITLHSAYWADTDPEACVDLSGLAVYTYGGGEEGFNSPAAVFGSGIPEEVAAVDECADKGGTLYDASKMEFCTSDQADGLPGYLYQADWPVVRNFFAAHPTKLRPTVVAMDAPGVGLAGQELSLPESIVVSAIQGFEPASSTSTSAEDLWPLIAMQGCFDDRSNGEDLGDVALEFTWEPSKFDFTQGGAVVDTHTFVRVTLTSLSLNWFGLTAYPARATAVVPDSNDVDGDGLSHIEIPASVLYQLPTTRQPPRTGLADPAVEYGYFTIEFQRVTEYTLATEKGNVVFSYVTGDFTFTDWGNPTEADGCHNCLDDDDDGWADQADPDCDGGTEETGFGTTACNDDVDNDRDGTIDSADEFCEDAVDDDESNCDNRRDDDRDGLTDADDPECQQGRSELRDDSICGNGDDDDDDGWIDDEDPDCDAVDAEVGFGTTGCNDGADNDGDELVDAEDPDCLDALGSEAG